MRISLKSGTVLLLAAASLAAVCAAARARGGTQAAPEPAYDLVITNARVVDGAGNPWVRADVAVRGGRIARVGRVAASEGKRAVDARGQVLAPGFIDVHTHVENVYDLPDAENFVRMGVTTLVTGNCGGSALDVGKFLGRASETPVAVNLATLVGHNTVRRAVLGEANRQPTPEELEKMRALVERAMLDGAVGLSTGLFYVPGAYAKTDEVVELAKVAARHGGVYATHMRDEGERVADSVRESIEIGERAGLPVEISHFKVSAKKLWGKSTLTLGLVRDARGRGLAVTVDQYAYTASSTSLDSRLPDWAEEGGREEGRKRIADPAQHARIVREMKDALKKSGFKDFSYASVASYAAKHEYDGKNIAEIAKLARGRSDVDSQVEQILEMYAAGGAAMVYHSMGEEDVRRIMREPFTMIASDSGVRRFGEGVPHPRGYGNNARVLAEYVRGLNLLSLEDAVRKMTSLPAQTFGLRDRGLVREGMAADLVVFDDASVSDPATFGEPHRYAAGFTYVIVNGEVVLDSGRMTGARPGAALRHAPAGAAQSS
ncbi:MAG TPA: D-aminoacylase [Pyrinomonadaceae bacterium]|nr:D-aminoacylase [Pyrinomonadaceae bacterium]